MTKIREIEETSDDFKRSWGAVFLSSDPYAGDPFRPDMATRTIFYPTNWFHLDEGQYDAVVGAAKEVGDDGFFLSVVELPSEGTWWCEFPTYEEYCSLSLYLMSSLHSRNSTWGILISADEQAVIGGSMTFGRYVRKAYPQWRQGMKLLDDDYGHSDWQEIYTKDF